MEGFSGKGISAGLMRKAKQEKGRRKILRLRMLRASGGSTFVGLSRGAKVEVSFLYNQAERDPSDGSIRQHQEKGQKGEGGSTVLSNLLRGTDGKRHLSQERPGFQVLPAIRMQLRSRCFV